MFKQLRFRMNSFMPVLTLIFSIYGCSERHVSEIGFLIPNLSDQRYLKDTTYLGARTRELGIKLIIKEAGNDAKVQEKEANDLIQGGVDLLVISAINQNLAANIVRDAHKNRITVIAYERLIKNCDLDYLVTFDHEKVGELQAKYITDKCKTGNYVIIGGDRRDRNAELIYKGQMRILGPQINSGRIKVIYTTFIEDWSPENAGFELTTVLDLSSDTPHAILSANDGMAGELLRVWNSRGENNVYCSGLDADLAACKRIARGEQTMTVYKSFKEMAYITADLADEILNKKKEENDFVLTNNGFKGVKTILLEPVTVDRENLKTTIIKDGFFTEEQINSD